MSDTSDDARAQAGACAYVLHRLLQRLEAAQPGLVHGMLEGAKADRAAVQAQGTMPDLTGQVFDEAIAMLGRIHAMGEPPAPHGKIGL